MDRSKMDINQIRDKLLTCDLDTVRGLLFDREDAAVIRQRIAKQMITHPGALFEGGSELHLLNHAIEARPLTDALRQYADTMLKTNPDEVSRDYIFSQAQAARIMAIIHFLLQEDAYVDWTKRRVDAILALDNWKHPLNDKSCPHMDIMAPRVGVCVAIAHEMLGAAYTAAESKGIADTVRDRVLLNFIAACKGRKEWWTKETTESNWTIMACGESGLASCHFAGYWPEEEVRESMGFAVRGVLETLDFVPAEGDWPEGVTYWFITMGMGARFAYALRRMTGGDVNLFEHPAFKTAGDFPMMMTSPGKRIYQFNDNTDVLAGIASQTLMLLAREFDRPDWLHVARQWPVGTPLYYLLNDPSIESKPTSRRTVVFPRTGLATIRSGWSGEDTFVGLKCGPSDEGHSHLDAASFVIESKGVPLVIDPGTWPYAGQIGYYDDRGPRWNWDALATVGHSTLLIDGKGQTWGSEYPGRMVSVDEGEGWSRIVADASKTYPGLLQKFIRTILLIGKDVIVVRDVIECEGERHGEWLLHYAGSIRGDASATVVENEGVVLTVTPFLPNRSLGWRHSDVERTSYYKDQPGRDVERTVRYRSFAPFRKASRFEFLFGFRVNCRPDGTGWVFEEHDGRWLLSARWIDFHIRPERDTLATEELRGDRRE